MIKKILLLILCVFVANLKGFSQENIVYEVVDEMPEFPGGVAKMNGFCVNLGAKDFIICKNISIVSIYDFCP